MLKYLSNIIGLYYVFKNITSLLLHRSGLYLMCCSLRQGGTPRGRGGVSKTQHQIMYCFSFPIIKSLHGTFTMTLNADNPIVNHIRGTGKQLVLFFVCASAICIIKEETNTSIIYVLFPSRKRTLTDKNCSQPQKSLRNTQLFSVCLLMFPEFIVQNGNHCQTTP